ncbi:MAG: EAL domain-containing protein [Sphaerochaetaceae bacterium]
MALLELPFKADALANPLTLLDHAIKAAKAKGRSQFIQCDTLILENIRRKNTIAALLQQAIENNRLSLYFQPIFSLHNGEMVLAEALLRLNSAEYGEISPSEFIPIAEETGLIGALGHWVLDRCCRLIDRIRTTSSSLPVISVNVSCKQFSECRMVLDVEDIIKPYNLPPGCIIFELTEHTFIGTSFAEIEQMMQALVDKKIQFHLDDFGTGYSNLSYVINLPFQGIKLDKSLVSKSTEHDKTYQFVDGFVAIIHRLGLHVIAEGIEEYSQISMLKDIGCDMAQGYLLQRPLHEEQFFNRYVAGEFKSHRLLSSGQLPLDYKRPVE